MNSIKGTIRMFNQRWSKNDIIRWIDSAKNNSKPTIHMVTFNKLKGVSDNTKIYYIINVRTSPPLVYVELHTDCPEFNGRGIA